MSVPLISTQRHDRWPGKLVQRCLNGHALLSENYEINISAAGTGMTSQEWIVCLFCYCSINPIEGIFLQLNQIFTF